MKIFIFASLLLFCTLTQRSFVEAAVGDLCTQDTECDAEAGETCTGVEPTDETQKICEIQEDVEEVEEPEVTTPSPTTAEATTTPRRPPGCGNRGGQGGPGRRFGRGRYNFGNNRRNGFGRNRRNNGRNGFRRNPRNNFRRFN